MPKLFFCTGTNASGKSSIARHFLNSSRDKEELLFAELKNSARILFDTNLALVGRYPDGVASGGCDTISPKSRTLSMLRTLWARPQDIFMEGYLIGTRVWLDELAAMGKELGERELIYLHPNAALETCFKRIEGRSGKTQAQLKMNGKNVIDKKKSCETLVAWIKENRPEWRVVDVDTENSTPAQICDFIKTL